MGAPSPLRGPSFRIRVYPPGRSSKRGPISWNSLATTSRSGMSRRTWRRAARSPRLANVISFSANGRSCFAFASVVSMPSCTNSCAAIVDNRSLWWAGFEPSRGPFFGFGTGLLLPQAETELLELGLDLVDRLLAEVADIHQLGLRLLHQVADGVDALSLEAVVRTDRKVQVLDRDRVVAGLILVLRRTDGDARRLGQVREELDELEQGSARGRERLARGDRAVRLDVQDQTVTVGHLLHARVLDRVGDLTDGREDRVHRDHADRIAGLL